MGSVPNIFMASPEMLRRSLRGATDFTGSLYESLGLPTDPAQWPGEFAQGAREIAQRPGETANLLLQGMGEGLKGQYQQALEMWNQPGDVYQVPVSGRERPVEAFDVLGLAPKARALQHAIPFAGPLLTRAGQQVQQGDLAGAAGTTTGAAAQLFPMMRGAQVVGGNVGRMAGGVRRAYAGSRLVSERGAIPLHSQLEKVLAERVPNRASAEQIRATVENPQSGVSPAEIEATGLKRFLAQAKGPVEKGALRDWIAENKVQVEEVVKSGKPALSNVESLEHDALSTAFRRGEQLEPNRLQRLHELDTQLRNTEPTKFSQWQLPGGENYREVLLQIPTKSAKGPPAEALSQEMFGRPFSQLEGWEIDQLYQEGIRRTPSDAPSFTGGHWDEPNVLAHIRMNDRIAPDGKKVLFVEEVQSDWARELRRAGPRLSQEQMWQQVNDIPVGGERRVVAQRVLSKLMDRGEGYLSSGERNVLRRDLDYWAKGELDFPRWRMGQPYNWTVEDALGKETNINSPPNAPLLDRWDELAMKRVLKQAADEGYDRVAWTTGEQQAARYDLSKHIDSIQFSKQRDGTYGFRAHSKYEQTPEIAKSGLTAEDLVANLGKDVAAQIVERTVNDLTGAPHWIQNADLRVGGEWASRLYDQRLPAVVNKLVKKYGGRVQEGAIRAGKSGREVYVVSERGGYYVEGGIQPRPGPFTSVEAHRVANDINRTMGDTTVHSLDLTPAMREAIKSKGFSLFEAAPLAYPAIRSVLDKRKKD